MKLVFPFTISNGVHSQARYFIAVFVLMGISGCVSDHSTDHSSDGVAEIEVHFMDPLGLPAPFFRIAVMQDDPNGEALIALASTDHQGILKIEAPPNATHLMYHDGYAVETLPIISSSTNVTLAHAPTATPNDHSVARSGLQVMTVQDMGRHDYIHCEIPKMVPGFPPIIGSCGLSEPTVEVDGAGTIYLSGVCCIGGAPPIWVSRDDAVTWQLLETPGGQRELFGIEGDFAIDDVGNMYFVDTDAAALQVSAWTSEGEHIHTVHHAAVPLVDRPWVRAEGDGTVHVVYSSGTGTTTFMRSTDHGLTFLETTSFSGNFGNIARGPEANELILAIPGEGPDVKVYESTDGGLSWDEGTAFTAPSAKGTYVVPLIDDAGNRYVVFSGTPTKGDPGYLDQQEMTRIYYASAPPGGNWSETIAVSPPVGAHYLPWAATAAEGALALAWYGTLGENATASKAPAEDEWLLFLSVTLDAMVPRPIIQTVIGDTTPVMNGPMGRQLLDFLQIDIGPNGALHVGYAHLPEGGEKVATTVYLQTYANLPLVGPDGLRNGAH